MLTINKISQRAIYKTSILITLGIAFITTAIFLTSFVENEKSRVETAYSTIRPHLSYLINTGDFLEVSRILGSIAKLNSFSSINLKNKDRLLFSIGKSNIIKENLNSEISFNLSQISVTIYRDFNFNSNYKISFTAVRPLNKVLYAMLIVVLFCLVSFFILKLQLERTVRIIKDPIARIHQYILNDQSEKINETFIAEEFESLKKLLNNYVDIKEATKDYEKKVIISSIAEQVSHDIRSPLTVLDTLLEDISDDIPETKRILVKSAVVRIHDIANDLLKKNKHIENSNPDIQKHSLSNLIEPVVIEKRYFFKNKLGISIEVISEKSKDLFSNVNSIKFKRVISNLLNNAVESIATDNGTVSIHIFSNSNNFNEVAVKDTGIGMSIETLKQIGNKGTTIGKKDGNGLGLYYAKATIESLGGTLKIESKVGLGTCVSITLPKSNSVMDLKPTGVPSSSKIK